MGVLIGGGLPAVAPLSGVFTVGAARASEDPAAFDRSYKQSGKLATQLAQRYDGALRQTVVRLAEVARQDPADLARNPLAIETSRAPWPIVTYLRQGDKFSLIPDGRALLNPEELSGLSGRKSRILVKGSTVVVAAPAGSDRITAVEIPLAAFTDPLASLTPGDDATLLLLDDQGRSLGRKSLGSDDQELLRSVSGESATTLVSKTSVLSLARVPSAGWTVILRLPLAEAYRGVALPELDERALPNPLYLVKRTQATSLEGLGKGLLFTFGGLALLVVALLVVRRRLRDPRFRPLRMPFSEGAGPFSAPLSAAQTGGLAVLEALVGEKAEAAPEAAPEAPAMLPPPPAAEGAASSVWRDTLQAQVSYLQAELQKTQEQLKQVAQQSPLAAVQAELRDLERRLSGQHDAELRAFSEALRQRLDLEARRLETLEQASRQQMEGVDRRLAQHEAQLQARTETLASKFDGLSEGLRQRFEQEDQLLAALDQEVDRARAEMEALRAQQARFGELSENKFGLMESELEGYRNQGMQADRQAMERIEVLAKALQELHAALGQAQASNGTLRQEVQQALAQAQQEHATLREELGTLSARVHRVVQLLAKSRPA